MPGNWVLSSTTDAYGSVMAASGDVGNPGQFILAAVPEPETYAMLLAGLGVIGSIARRRRAR
ncbi:MAG: PEP-CTERM sorting domain-containing protein [Rhodoferax sp.]|nr:PEP-CTERM sorting domain-containing protein [Rhodoferax sp.]MCB2027543.1 PEP-CTERM sorting domain-containing protein [Rhodoferax sp.]